jgi:hypothetical protein
VASLIIRASTQFTRAPDRPGPDCTLVERVELRHPHGATRRGDVCGHLVEPGEGAPGEKDGCSLASKRAGDRAADRTATAIDLIASLEHSDWQVGGAAARALGRIGDRRGQQPLVELRRRETPRHWLFLSRLIWRL